MTGFALEVALHWAGVAAYGVGTAFLVHSVLFASERSARRGRVLALVGLVPHAVALALRWRASGHGPYMLKYEVLSSTAWVVVAVFLGVVWRRAALRAFSMVVMPACILAIAIGLFSNPEIRDLPPTLRSIWLVFHILFAKLAAASFLIALASSVILLLKARPREATGWLARTPPVEALDAYAVRMVGFGLTFWTVTIAAGGVWAHQSWGRYWGWDPIETWSLVSWLAFGLYLHARLFFRLRLRTSAWAIVGCFAVFVLSFLVLPFLIPTLHSAYMQ